MSLTDLKYICGEIERLGIEYWLCDGTLLGLVRQGSLIKGDDDLDIGFSYDDRDGVLELFTDLGLTPVFADDFSFRFISENSPFIAIDAMFFKKSDDGFLYITYDMPFTALLMRLKFRSVVALLRSYQFFFKSHECVDLTKSQKLVSYDCFERLLIRIVNNLREIRPRFGFSYPISDMLPPNVLKCSGSEFRVPRHRESFLQDTYGVNWKTPDPGYDPYNVSYAAIERWFAREINSKSK